MTKQREDWIDGIKQERDNGVNRALLSSQHDAVNARYPGCTLEHCCECGNPTENAGAGEDSLFVENGDGPYCWECWQEVRDKAILDGKGEQ